MMRSLVLVCGAAALLAACGDRGAKAADDAATQPAGTQPAPTAQHQAAPQTGPNTPPADNAQAPQPPAGNGHAYADCMSEARKAHSDDERHVREGTCANLPGHP